MPEEIPESPKNFPLIKKFKVKESAIKNPPNIA